MVIQIVFEKIAIENTPIVSEMQRHTYSNVSIRTSSRVVNTAITITGFITPLKISVSGTNGRRSSQMLFVFICIHEDCSCCASQPKVYLYLTTLELHSTINYIPTESHFAAFIQFILFILCLGVNTFTIHNDWEDFKKFNLCLLLPECQFISSQLASQLTLTLPLKYQRSADLFFFFYMVII